MVPARTQIGVKLLREMSNEEFEELVAARLNAANVEPSEGASEAC